MRFGNPFLMGLVLVFSLFLACGESHASAKYPKGVWQCEPVQLEGLRQVPEELRKQWLDIADFHDDYTLTRLYGKIGDVWLHIDYTAHRDEGLGLAHFRAIAYYNYNIADASIHFKDIEVDGLKLSGTLRKVEITDTGLVFSGNADDGTQLQLFVTTPDFMQDLQGEAPFKAYIQAVLPEKQPVNLPGEGVLHKMEWHYVFPQK